MTATPKMKGLQRPREELTRELATALGVTLKPGGGYTAAPVDLPDLGVTVEITMTVHALVSREARINFQEEALARIADHETGAWTDGCSCRVRDRGHYVQRGATASCKKPVIGVVVHKQRTNWTREAGDVFTYAYYFRCHVHLSAARDDEATVVFRDTLGAHALKAARQKRAIDIGERERLRKMTPEERIIEDAKVYGREAEVRATIASDAELEPTPLAPRRMTSHSYRCDKLRATAGDPGKFPGGHPDVACTCGFEVPEDPICDCELRDRQWDPNTGRCRTCGRRFNARPGSFGMIQPDPPTPPPPCPCDGDYCTDPSCNYPDPVAGQS